LYEPLGFGFGIGRNLPDLECGRNLPELGLLALLPLNKSSSLLLDLPGAFLPDEGLHGASSKEIGSG
jgi:hypothetical protein